VRPLALHPPPIDVGFADKFLQEVVRVEDPPAEAGQHDQRLVKVVQQKLACLDAAEQHDLQFAIGGRQVLR
jgi:hypothetical protein